MRLWVIASLLLVPGAAAAPVDLYMHLAGFQDLPTNTQQPQGESWQRTGTAGHSACVPAAFTSMGAQSRHTWYAFSSPGLVEYGISDEGPRTYYERGLGMDLHLDPELTPVLSWHLVAIGPAEGAAGLPSVVPEVIVRVQVRASDEISVGHETFDAAPLIASGEVGPVTLHEAVDHPSVTRHDIGDLVVYAFEVPLELHNTTILQHDGYNIRIDAMMDNPYCTQSASAGYVMPDLVVPYQGHGLWNRLHVGVENALELRYLHLQYIAGDIAVHAGGTSPFGQFDIASDGIRVDGPASLAVEAVDLASRAHEHGRLPTYEQTWIINVTDAEHGLYTVDITLTNLQGTANVTARATFELGDHGMRICHAHRMGQECLTYHSESEQVPALPLAWLFAGALLLRRRTD